MRAGDPGFNQRFLLFLSVIHFPLSTPKKWFSTRYRLRHFMRAHQRTVSNISKFEGTGLHTGNTSTIEFHPAPEDYGIRFVRSDMSGLPEIPALVDFVSDISRGTTLSLNGASVHTVEHVLAAVVGLEIDNVRIELTANEPPIGD